MILFLGLKTSNFFSKSNATSSIFGKKLENDRFFTKDIWFKHYCAITDSIDSISSRFGFPNSSKILSIWFKVEFPGKMALPKYIYPKMQPTDHISTAFVYLEEPRRISGARYHLVATYSVMIGSATDWFTVAIDRARPKSASLARQSESSKMFDGFKSLCISYPECMYLIPFNTLR